MRKFMIKRSILFISIITVFSINSCIKETYDMNKFSKKVQLSPTLAISAVKGDILFSDMVKPNDTIVFDQNKLVKFIFKKDSIVDLKVSDFLKAPLLQKTASIGPDSFDLDIADILSHISGDFQILNPTIKFNYTNSFRDSIKIILDASGRRKNNTVDLNLPPFTLTRANPPAQQVVTDSYIINKSNSNLPILISLPPEVIRFSGSATLSTTLENFLLGVGRLVGSLEIEVPMELRVNNLQFTDTVDNFLKDESSSNDNPVAPEDFRFLRIIISAENGFPLGASLKMSLYDSSTNSTKSTVDATGLLEPAPVDSNGKVTGVTKTSTTIEINKEFFSSVNKADMIIFRFTLTSTGNGSQDIKIYSDYRIKFNAALVVKPEINL